MPTETTKSYLSQITLPNGTTYELKDLEARDQIRALTGGDAVVFVGVSTTELTDGGNETPTVGGNTKTPATGQLFFYGTEEFIYGADSKWHALGSLDTLGVLAYKDDGSVVVPYPKNLTFSGNAASLGGSVTIPSTYESTFSGNSLTSTGSYTPAGNVTVKAATGTDSKNVTFNITKPSSGTNYTPEGTIAATFTGTSNTSTGSFTPEGTISATGPSSKAYAVSPAASGTVTYTPAGSISLTDESKTVSISNVAGTSSNNTFSVGGNVTLSNENTNVAITNSAGTSSNYTLRSSGSVSAPTISVKTAGSTNSTLKPVTAKTVVSALTTAAPNATAPANAITYYSVSGETLSLYQIGATTEASVTLGSAVTVKTGDATYEASAPTFTGDYHKLAGSVSVPTSASLPVTYYKLSGTTEAPASASFTGTGVRLVTESISTHTGHSFTGTAGNVSVSGTSAGTVDATFSGTPAKFAGTVAIPKTPTATFAGTAATVTVTGTPTGTVTTETDTTTNATLSMNAYTPTGSITATQNADPISIDFV